ncbi:MAG TPA: hypothetical protein VEL76_20930 [Gemmataceae bacterium]|nr:hypothetical protein [Gemmataceae bacterium]
MKRLPWVVLGLLVLLRADEPAAACSLCGSLQNRETFRHEMEQAKVVLYGAVTRSELSSTPGALAGTGSSEFQILRVLKSDPALIRDRKSIQLPGYLPILDPKNPPRLIYFFSVIDGALKPRLGREVRSQEALKYVEGILTLQGKDRTQALLYFFRFLDDEDPRIAEDAFLEFARSSDAEVGAVARHLPAEQLRRLIGSPRTPPERLGLYAFLLSAAGNPQDADLLRGMIERPTPRSEDALGGLLCGYINLRPREGWDLAIAVVTDNKRSFSQRFAVAHALRFFYGWKPAESRPHVLRVQETMIADGAVADLAIEDLRRWKIWDLTGKILAQYNKQSHDAPIARLAILRYALCCPLPEARRFVEEVRRREPQTVRQLEESLELERQE